MKKSLVFTLALFVLLLFSSVCFADDRYQLIYFDDKKDVFIDTESIKYEYYQYQQTVDKTKINVWIKTTYSETRVKEILEERKQKDLSVKGFDNLSHTLTHYTFSRDNKLFILDSIDYSKNGTPIGYYYPYDYTWEDIVPDSLGELIHQAVWAYSYDTTNSITMRLRAER